MTLLYAEEGRGDVIKEWIMMFLIEENKLIKKNILLIFEGLVLLILLINFVSAGLCKGSDGYYHDCNDFSDNYYRHNFYPNYKTEYYKETSSSASSIISIKEDRYNYEEISADSYAESNIEVYKIERDYSSPKTRYDKYGRKYYDKYDDYDDNYYEWDDEPHLVMFVNQAEPIHYQRRQTFNNQINDNKNSVDDSYWRYKEPYVSSDYYDAGYDDDYYTPRYDNYNQGFNWRW